MKKKSRSLQEFFLPKFPVKSGYWKRNFSFACLKCSLWSWFTKCNQQHEVPQVCFTQDLCVVWSQAPNKLIILANVQEIIPLKHRQQYFTASTFLSLKTMYNVALVELFDSLSSYTALATSKVSVGCFYTSGIPGWKLHVLLQQQQHTVSK